MSRRDDVLVSTEWLGAHLGDHDLRVVDVRGKVLPPGTVPRYVPKRADYDAGHVPGAAFVDWTRDIVDADDPVPAQIARPEAFAAAMGAIGVGDSTLVVAYDDYDHAFAGRLAWALRYYGHDAVRILDGGWTRWVAEGRPVTTEMGRHDPARFTPRPRAALRRTADEVEPSPSATTRCSSSTRARPSNTRGPRARRRASGTSRARSTCPTPGWSTQRRGVSSRPARLARVFAEAGADVHHLPREVVVYCNGGVTCNVPLVALRLLGRDDVAVYDGSWNEWGNDARRPIRSGPLR